MPEFNPVQSNFTGGEFSPRLLGNFELEKYKQGVKTLENFLVQPYGGVSRRGGFKYVAEVKDSSKTTILQEFRYKDEFSYILEFGNLYIRFYRNQAQITDGSAVEVVTTYLEAELRDLRFTQDEDTLYIVHKNHPPAKLTRTSHTDWTLETIGSSFGYDHEWTGRTASQSNAWFDVCWSPKVTKFVAVSTDGTNRVMTSYDGITWANQAHAAAVAWTAICWSPDLELFCAVAQDGVVADQVMTSPDGIIWTKRTSASARAWIGVCWSPALTLFVAVAYDGTTANQIMTSPDGITWTSRTSPHANAWQNVCWSPEQEIFVAVSIDGVTYRSMTSTDGVTWSQSTISTADEWRYLCWSPELELFVAVADTGTNRIATSPNGKDWTVRIDPGSGYRSVCWSPELGLFVAVAGSDDAVATSSDGISWIVREGLDPPAEEDWRRVCWSPELRRFCAVDASGLHDPRVMTSEASDHPSLCWFFEQRFFVAATPNYPNRVWGSKSTDYFNFDTGTGLDNEAIDVRIKEAIKLLWVTTSVAMILGAHNAEFKLAANNLNEALTPTNIRPVKVTSYGGAFLPAIDVDGNAIFVQRGLRKIRRIEYELAKDKYKAIDISILGEHITESGLIDIAYINEPESLIWGVRDDGKLICLTYEPEYQIYAWSKHVIGGANTKVKSIAVSDAIEANEDELWAVVSRTVNSATVQYIEFLKQGLTPEDIIQDAFFVDSGVTKTGNDFTTFDGLDHLEGETVAVFADGKSQATKIVSGGEITITAADKAHAGLIYASTLETLPIEGGNPIGSAMGKIKRISKVVLRVYRSLEFTISDLLNNTSEIVTLSTVFGIPQIIIDTEELDFHGTHETGGQIKISVTNPVPFTLLAIMYKARTGE